MNDKIISSEWLMHRLKDELCFYPVMVSKAIEDAPKLDVISREVVNQLLWEMDIMEHQLKDIGVQPMERIDKDDIARIVRCKNCKYWNTEVSLNSIQQRSLCNYHKLYTEGNDYCSKGVDYRL